ncbi:MAG: N4 gp52-like protein [uncultured bacterium]|nr:MAG: N4 gp52-like protein [uncultured bacterium]
MSSVYGDFRPMPSPYLSMGGLGQLGSGTYGAPPMEMYSQPVLPQDWSANAMQAAQGAGFNSGANAMNNTRDLSGESSWTDGMLGPNGWGGMALNAGGALMQGFLGMKQYGLAKQTLAENKRQFQMNYDAQRQSTNTRLEDRQRARVASNSGAYQSVGDYMGANKIA